MKKKYLLLLLTCVISLAAIAQTKLIAHRSHSGSNAGFNRLLRESPFSSDNLGAAPTRLIKKAQLDSVIFVKENVAVMVTSVHVHEYDWGDDNIYNSTKCLNPGIWKPGRDTVYNHPLFSKQHSLDSIKDVLKKQYNFKNDINKVAFVGYSNQKPKQKEEPKQPILDEPPVLIAQELSPNQESSNTTIAEQPKHKKKNRPFIIGSIIGGICIVLGLSYLKWSKNENYTP